MGDFDGDNDLDIIAAGSTLALNRNNGGSFTGTNLNTTFNFYPDASWVDFDNDGDLDVLHATSLFTRFMRNDGPGGFTALATDVFPGLMFPMMDWGDYDRDGDLDLVLAGQISGGRICRIYQNNGNGNFVDISAILPGLETGTVAWVILTTTSTLTS